MDYFFEEQQQLVIEVYDADDANNLDDLTLQQFCGSASFQLARVVGAKNNEITLDLSEKNTKAGQITVISEEHHEGDKHKQLVF